MDRQGLDWREFATPQDLAEAQADAVAEADLITTAVGPNIVPLIAKNLVPGIRRRMEKGEETPFSVIACENAVGASTILKKALFESLTPNEQTWAEEHMGFPDSAVDRIVPLLGRMACGSMRKLTTISATRSASRLPVRRKNGTRAQRQLSSSALIAT